MSTTSQDREFGSYFLDDIANWIGQHYNPEDVFDESELIQWALDNGFEKKEE